MRKQARIPAGICMAVIIGLIYSAAPALCEDAVIPFDSERWQLGPGGRVIDHLERKALTGPAELKGVVFENGVVEFDMAFSGGRNFPGLVFRKQDEENYEEFYARPHKSGQPDALQYTPVINRQSAWQLYYGEGYTGTWTFPLKQWIHFKLEISGTQARVYIGERKQPALVIRDLKHGRSRGALALKVTGPPGLSHFSNFKFRHDDDLAFDAPPQTETPFGMLTHWELSGPIKLNRLDTADYPGREKLEGMAWQKVESEATGLVNISRYARKGAVVPDCVLARTRIHADSLGGMRLQFGYSDQVSIFVNGRLLYSGSSLFRQRDPFFQGLVGLFDTVRIPLQAGDNELLLIVTDSMGGWGFMCRNIDSVYRHGSVEPAWEIVGELSYPESVIHDRDRDVLYVSNLYSDTRQSISRLSMSGEVLDREWVTDLNRPTGMVILGETLFVVERTGLAEIDIASGSIRQRHAAPRPGFLNDIAADEAGRLYVSDGQRNRILRFADGEFSEFIKGRELATVNGLHYQDGRLYIGCSLDASIKQVDPSAAEPTLETLARLDPGAIVDGIESDGTGGLLVSDYNGKVYRIAPDGTKTLLLNTTAPKKYCANFGYIPEKGLLIIPTLNDNRIMAFKLNLR